MFDRLNTKRDEKFADFYKFSSIEKRRSGFAGDAPEMENMEGAHSAVPPQAAAAAGDDSVEVKSVSIGEGDVDDEVVDHELVDEHVSERNFLKQRYRKTKVG